MMIPIYAVTGFLDAGKTTFLNQLLNRHDWKDVKILVLQFESGEEEFHSRFNNCTAMKFPKKLLEQQPRQIVDQIHNRVKKGGIDEIWVEWNGVVPFSELQDLFLHPSLRGLCKIHKVIHLADAAALESLLGRTGGALPGQIANCDIAVVRGASSPKDLKRIRQTLRGINPGIAVYHVKAYHDFQKQLFKKRGAPVCDFFLITALIAGLYFAAGPLFSRFDIQADTIVNVFLGILLQAVPFLLIGVLLSSAIQIFVSRDALERRFPKSFGMGMLVAVLGGFCLPVCDCASIPIFRSLVKKGVPLPVAVTFMTATPVVNPVVILSTWYAFGGNSRMVVGRVCFGILSAVLIGLFFKLRPPKEAVLTGGTLDGLMCGCGCYEDIGSVTTFTGKIGVFLRHSQAEFFSVGKYLVIGTFVSSVFQTMGTGAFASAQSGAGLAVSILVMMVMAFVLSLCSSSDAVVARSLSGQFPAGAIMGFLVFGPMMDIKNVMMLSSGFSPRFIGKLLAVSFTVCFAVVFLAAGFGGI